MSESRSVIPSEKIDALIIEAERMRLFHKARGRDGQIEAAAAAIRIKALKDAKEAIDESSGR